MRYDTPVFFQKFEPGPYNEETGNYEDDIIYEEERYASVTDASAETLNLVYGELKQGALVIRLQNIYKEPFDRIRVRDKVYRVDMERRLRVKHNFVVSEVQ